MKRSSITRWATAVAASAVLALPVSAFAQSTGSQPPATGTQPPTSTGQPPATSAAPEQQPAGQVDADAAKQHLTAARNSLSEMTQLPAASQLTGDARTQVSQLITNFNELITTKTDWRASFAKVETNLNALIGSATTDEAAARTTGTEGAVGTSGTVSGLDPALKAKLVEVRNHLDKFEKVAGGKATSPADPAAASSTGTGSMAGSSGAATAATATEQQTAAAAPSQADKDELLRHIAAIDTILSGQTAASAGTSATGTAGTSGTTGGSATQAPVTLTAAQVEQLKTHLNELKRLLNQR
jgi:hypothetical protein